MNHQDIQAVVKVIEEIKEGKHVSFTTNDFVILSKTQYDKLIVDLNKRIDHIVGKAEVTS